MIIKKLLSVKKSLINNKHGFALLELVITLTLLGIILAMGFMFYSFGVSTYRISEEQTDVQQNARLAADFIIKELRVAEKVIIVDGYEDLDIGQLGMTHEEDTPVYYLYLKDNSIYYQEHENLAVGELPGPGANLAALQESIAANIDFNLTFKKSASEEGKDNIMEFDLSAINANSGRDYRLDTQLLVLNLDEIEVDNLSGDSGTALAYQVPAPAGSGIETVRIDPTNHVWENSENIDIEVAVRTLNVPDDPDYKDVELEFFRRELDYTLTEMPAVDILSSTIIDNRAFFWEQNNNPLSIPKDLDFGYYYIRATVDCQYEGDEFCDRNCGGMCLMQGRHYYVYAHMWNIEVKELNAPPKMADIKANTGGVPVGQPVILGTEEMIRDDDYFYDILFLIYDNTVGVKEYLDTNILDLRKSPAVEQNGILDFEVWFKDYDGTTSKEHSEKYAGRHLTFEFYIGLAEFVYELHVPDFLFVLTDLTVEDDGGTFTLQQESDETGYDQDVYNYSVEVEQTTDKVTLKAEHNHYDEDDLSMVNLKLVVDGVIKTEVENNLAEVIYLGSYDTTIEVILTDIDDGTELNTYSVTVYRVE